MNRITRVTSVEWIFVSLISLALGIQRGLSFGQGGSNHEPYVVPGIHQADPSILASDWWTTQTWHPHIAFTCLVSVLEDLGILAWGLAIANVALVAASAMIVRAWMRLYLDRYELLAWLLVLLLFFSVSGPRSIGESYLASESLQPSTIASVSFLAGLFLFHRGNYLATGLVLLVGGLFHVNFLILQIALFALLSMAPGWQGTGARLLAVIVPSTIALAFFVPGLLQVVLDSQSANAARIFVEELFPFHYKPLSSPYDVMAFAAWLMLGFIAAAALRKERKVWRTTANSLLVLAGFVGLPVLATTLWPDSAVTRLFPWRLAPFAMLFAQLVFVSALIIAWTGPAAIRQCIWSTWRTLALLFCLVALLFHYHAPGQLLILGVFTTALVLGWICHAVARAERLGVLFTSQKGMVTATVVATLVLVTSSALRVNREDFDLVLAPGNTDKHELFVWASGTPKDSLFLIPPNFEDFRVMTRRAVVVDWKTNPVRPGEVMEWSERLLTVSGTERPLSLNSVMAGYQDMSDARFREICHQFGISYAIFQTPLNFADGTLPVAFQNDAFIVLDVTGSTP